MSLVIPEKMTDDELREAVRESIARLRAHGSPPPAAGGEAPHVHASHLRLPIASGGDESGACVIEPAVRCTHCGYCQSLGH